MTTYARAALTKTARHAKIITLLEQREVRSQSELAELLAEDGVQVTQGTLSRDLVEIGALRIRSSGGYLVYAAPGQGGDRTPHVSEFAGFEARLARLCGRSWSPLRHRRTLSCSGRLPGRRSTLPRPLIGSVGSPSSAASPATTPSC